MLEEKLTGLSVNNIPLVIKWTDGVISDVQEISFSDLDDRQLYIAPGLIDNQVNGYNGVDFCSYDLTVDQVRQTVRELWKTGVTSFLPTLITMPEDRLIHSLTVLAEAIRQPDLGPSLPGIHLEGPYISEQPGYRGAHNAEWSRQPDWQEFQRLQTAAGGKITQITLAPELPGAMDFIRKCRENNIIVAMGHHAASANLIHEAVKTGVSVSTHLGNGCANMIDRHHNILWPQLADDNLMATIIADGYHLTPDEMRVIYKLKAPDNLCLVSDLVKFGGMPPGEYQWNGNTLRVGQDGVVSYGDERVLAGATYPLHTGISNIMKHSGCSLALAFDLVTRNPARLSRLQDRGLLKAGCRADVIRFRIENGKIKLHETWVKGHRMCTV